jgi:hypothetical protein
LTVDPPSSIQLRSVDAPLFAVSETVFAFAWVITFIAVLVDSSLAGRRLDVPVAGARLTTARRVAPERELAFVPEAVP